MLYQWVTAIMGGMIAFTIVYLIRRDHLHARYAIWWLPVAFIVLLLGLFPHFSDRLARMLGVSYGPVLLIVVAISVGFIKVLLMDIERSRNETRLNRMIQEVAMMELRLRQLEKSVSPAATPAGEDETPAAADDVQGPSGRET
jgi:hypothetical protein